MSLNNRDDKKNHNEHNEEWEFTEEELEAFFNEEEEDDLDIPPPFWLRKKVRMWATVIIAVMMFGNVLAFLPSIFSIPAIQFLKKSSELSQNESIQAYKEAVVVIKSENRKGTGFHIGGGIIVTNDHVVRNANQGMISFENGKIFRGEVIARDTDMDIALLHVDETSMPALSLDQSPEFIAEESIYVIGNPLSFNGIANEGEIFGMLADRSPPLLAIDAPIYRGNSGSPVINRAGKVIAVVFATTRIKSGEEKIKVGLAVPVNLIIDMFDEIIIKDK